MSAWRLMIVAVGLIGLAAEAHADTYPLVETVQPGDCFRVQLDMKLNGELRVQKLDKTDTLELKAVAHHEYPERILSVGKDGVPDKTVRLYEAAKATITRVRQPPRNALYAMNAVWWSLSVTRKRVWSTRPPARSPAPRST